MELEQAPHSSPVVVLLDVATATELGRMAPQTVSWAGGVWLPPESAVRRVRDESELVLVERALRDVLAADPDRRRELRGSVVALDLASRRLFTALPDATVFDRAEELLDDGLVGMSVVR